MKSILVIAPHPDDETIGVGGTLIRHKLNGDELNLIIVTKPNPKNFSKDFINERNGLFEKLNKAYEFKENIQLDFFSSEINSENLLTLICSFSDLIKQIKPHIVYLCHPSDAHTDHYFTFKAAIACLKKFRCKTIKKILLYETISETNFSSELTNNFSPNYYIDITNTFDEKMKVLDIYPSEFKEHPFPRSEMSIRSQAILRGSESDCKYAEAFQVFKVYE